jgi:hypothetical protein
MDISQSGPAHKPAPKVPANRAQLAERLHALRQEIALNSRLIDNPRHAERRELLVMRLDETQARAADVFARLVEVAS